MTQPTPRQAAEAIGEQDCKLCRGQGRTEGVRMMPHKTPVGATEYQLVAFDEPCAWCEETGRLSVDRMEMILLGKRAWSFARAAREWGMPTRICQACNGNGGVGKRGGKLHKACLACAGEGEVSPAYRSFEEGHPLPLADRPTIAVPLDAPTPYAPNRAARRAR